MLFYTLSYLQKNEKATQDILQIFFFIFFLYFHYYLFDVQSFYWLVEIHCHISWQLQQDFDG